MEKYIDALTYAIRNGKNTKAIELSPTNPVGYHNRGFSYSPKGWYQEAIKDYTTGLGIRPSVQSYVSRGSNYVRIGDYNKAIEDFKSALELDPTHKNAADWLSYAYGIR